MGLDGVRGSRARRGAGGVRIDPHRPCGAVRDPAPVPGAGRGPSRADRELRGARGAEQRLAWEPGEASLAVAVADEVAVVQDSSSLLSIRPALDVADMYAGVAPSVVKILVSDGAGSGVRVAAGIVTNAHVVGDETSVTVVLGNGQQVTGTVVKVDQVADLALVTTEGWIPELEIERASFQRIGDSAYVVGFPRSSEIGGAASLSRGIISGFRNGQPGVSWIQTDAAMNPGNSGGGLFNGQGKLIGIPAWGLRGAEGLNFAISADTVTAFLARPGSRRGAAPTVTPVPRVVPTATPVPRIVPTATVNRPNCGEPCVVVDQSGRGDWRTIGEAVAMAEPGKRTLIWVRPGTYKEPRGIRINNDVRIVGEGGRSKVIVEGGPGAHVFTFTAGSATLTGLTIRMVGTGPADIFWGAIDVKGGKPMIEDCDLTSSAGSAVYIHGAGANPTIRNCTMRNSGGSGVIVSDQGQGTIEQCVISGNALGVDIRTGGNLTVRDCEIRDNLVGVFVHDSGQGTFTGNTLTGNAWAAWRIHAPAGRVTRTGNRPNG
ncbi:MAG: hypothetical protein EBT09_08985 [Actinobacteria bacterium]|nr:hypothetical protein [Actinomycetota bacterium]